MRSKIILTLAIVMGLFTTLLFYKYMSQMDQAVIVKETMVDVVVSKQTIKKNQLVAASMLEKKQVPLNGLHQGTISETSGLVGKFATSDIAAGEPITLTRLADTLEEALIVSRRIKDGYRAVSVGVNFVQSVSNLIEPEDYVDVIVSITDETTKEIDTELILQKVRVLAIGRRMVEVDAETEYAEYSSVSLELNASDTVKLVNADEQGNITLALYTRIITSEQEQVAK
ncbi:MAG TPA: Flp pilus assembly protein CpaB [Bacilli bacterium]